MLTLLVHAPAGLRPELAAALRAQVPDLARAMVVVPPHPSHGEAWSAAVSGSALEGHLLLLDGGYQPEGWSLAAFQEGLESFHLCTFSLILPGPRNLAVNDRYGFLEGGLHPGALLLRRDAVHALASAHRGSLFHPAFAGVPGYEMDHLGDQAYHLGLSCGVLKGSHSLRPVDPLPAHPRAHEQLALRLRLRSMLRIREDAGTRTWRMSEDDGG
jgi:hypothetical protein